MFALSGCQISPKAQSRRTYHRRVTHGVRVQYGGGDIYVGDATNSSSRLPHLFIPHGSGYLTKKNPSPNSKLCKYYGKWKYGKMDGEGGYEKKKKSGAKVTYRGQLAKNGKQGEGKMDTNGEIYQGKWLNNQRNGTGKCFYKNGDVYRGKWVNGKRCGQGRLKSKDGSLYVGSWMDNKQHGSGQLYYPDSSLAYEGDWVMGKMSGEGVLRYQANFGAKSLSRRCYEGCFEKNKFEGRGTFYFPMGNCMTTGVFCRNQFHGSHTMHWKNGLQLTCSFTRGRLDPKATALFPDSVRTPFILDNWVARHNTISGMVGGWQTKLKKYMENQHEKTPFQRSTVFSSVQE